MFMVEKDANLIYAKPMKNRMEDGMIGAYQVLWNRITFTGVCIPKKNILDNESSDDFKRVIKNRQSCNWFHHTLII